MNEILSVKKNLTMRTNIKELYSNTHLLETFNVFCTQLTERIKHRKTIQELSLSTFSNYTRRILHTNLNIASVQYDNLLRYLNNYWHYELIDDEDLRRKCSYIQLYQMVCMIKQNNNDLETELKVHVAAKNQDFNSKLIKQIHETPGINFKVLQDKIQLNPNTLQDYLKKLEDNKFVSSHRNGKQFCYILTTSGDTLYQDLCTEHNKWVDQWSYQRLFAYVAFVKLIQHHEENQPIPIQTVVDFISSLNEDQTTKLLTSCLNRYVKMRSSVKVKTRMPRNTIINEGTLEDELKKLLIYLQKYSFINLTVLPEMSCDINTCDEEITYEEVL